MMTSAVAPVAVEAQGQEPEQSRSLTSQVEEYLYFRYDRGRDKPSDVRTALLTISVLIATATYQAVLSPPGGVWQENKSDVNPIQVAGESIMGTNSPFKFAVFFFGNALGFVFSLYMIEILTLGFPLRLELRVTMLALSFTYGSSLVTISPSGFMGLNLQTFSVVFVFFLPFLFQMSRNPKWFLTKLVGALRK